MSGPGIGAFGYSNGAVAIHYLEFALVAVLVGALVGTGVGLWLGSVINRLYVDDEPFEPMTGRLRNNWKLFAEFVDVEGVSTGKYNKLADWGGWQTTLRTDGVSSLDFTLISLREIQAGQW